MLMAKKKEVFTITEFLARQPKESDSKRPLTPVYGFMGLDTTSNSISPMDINMPYIIVFTVTGVLILSTIMQTIFIAHGNPRKAETVESITKFIMPIGFYAFLVYGIFTVFL